MLVLTRKRGEKIMIGDDICVTIIDIDGPKIRVGIEAPRQVEVFRMEIYDARKLLTPDGDGRTDQGR